MRILLTADWHLRDDRPLCRTDENWIETQRNDVREVISIAENQECDEIWVLGDIFDVPRVSPELINMLIDELKKSKVPVGLLEGNHDLPYHNYDNLNKCSLGILETHFKKISEMTKIQSLSVISPAFGMDPKEVKSDIWCTHQLVFKDDASRPIDELGKTAQQLLDEQRDVEYIFTGDYHHGYIYKEDWDELPSRWVVTPGCLNIQKGDMKSYKPFVVVFDTSDVMNPFEQHFLEDDSENVSNEHLKIQHQRDERLERCMEAIRGSMVVELDFVENLRKSLPDMDKRSVVIIEEVIEHINSNKGN